MDADTLALCSAQRPPRARTMPPQLEEKSCWHERGILVDSPEWNIIDNQQMPHVLNRYSCTLQGDLNSPSRREYLVFLLGRTSGAQMSFQLRAFFWLQVTWSQEPLCDSAHTVLFTALISPFCASTCVIRITTPRVLSMSPQKHFGGRCGTSKFTHAS